jgi:hypothetical protein
MRGGKERRQCWLRRSDAIKATNTDPEFAIVFGDAP